jgi:D-glycero-D-manno-heptose 1,7-bisphosphate phosphatase
MEYKKALILDRDGVINHDYGHVHKKNNFRFIEGIFELCKYFVKQEYMIIIVTNQAGIGKNMYSNEEFQLLNDWMIKQFEREGIIINKTYYCPHTLEDNCECRKPKPGMIIDAISEFGLEPNKCVMIGDKSSDYEAGKAAGIGTLLLFNEKNHKNTLLKIKKYFEEEI